MKKIFLLAATIICFSNLINAQAGQLDSSFGTNGVVTTDFGIATTFRGTAVQKDGKIIAAGDHVLARYNIDGSLDKTFSIDGKLTTNAYINSAAIQKDGKIIAAGGYDFARYNTDGSLDITQITDDIVFIFSVAIQSDGKILVAGGENFKFQLSNPVITRYNTDGSLDKTFGTGGKQTLVLSTGEFGSAASIVIQNDGKIVMASLVNSDSESSNSFITVSRLNTDGTFDSTFGVNGRIALKDETSSCAVIVQNDNKIVVAGTGNDYRSISKTKIYRFNSDGSNDSSFHANDLNEIANFTKRTSLALQDDGKVVVSGLELVRLNTDGSLDSSFNIKALSITIQDIAIGNNKLYVVGGGYYGVVARFLLAGNDTPPTVSLTTPANNATYLAPAWFWLRAAASDADGTISKVEFYNGSHLLHTEFVTPYGFKIRDLPVGNYTLTAKATDNSGLVTTSAPVHISVVPNKAPVVSITTPSNNQSFAAPAYIHFEAAASDSDGRITKVKFYNGSTLLRTEYKYPYTYVWKDVPGGTYTITAVATDNWGAQTTSAPVTVRVTSPNIPIVSSRPIDNKTGIIGTMDIKFAPNPATNAVNIYMNGSQQNKPLTISVISVSGIVMKTMQINNSIQTIQLDVSSLVRGVYTIKLTSGNKMTYKQFVKL